MQLVNGLRFGSKAGFSGAIDGCLFFVFRLDFDFLVLHVDADFLDRRDGEQLGELVDRDVKLEDDSCPRE